MRWLLVDGIDTLVVGERAAGHKTWSGDEVFFEDHFPSFPVVPGVLVMEALAQLAGKLIGYTVRQERGDCNRPAPGAPCSQSICPPAGQALP